MAEQNTEPNVNTEPTAQGSTAEPAANNSGNQTKTLEFTQDALNAMQKDARLGGENSILKKLGVKDKSELQSLMEGLAAYHEAKAAEQTDGDKLKDLSERFDKLTNDHTASLLAITGYEQREILRGHGLTDPEDLEIYAIRIGKLTNDEIDFKGAADIYFTKHPFTKPEEKPKPPTGALMPGYVGPKNKNNNIPATNFTQALFGGRK